MLIFLFFCLSAKAQIQLFSLESKSLIDSTEVFTLVPHLNLIQNIGRSRAERLTLEIPIGHNGLKTIILEKTHFFDRGTLFFERHINGQREITDLKSLHYTGKVEGAKKSLVTLSIYQDEILAVISFDKQNWNLQKDSMMKSYRLFNDDRINVNSRHTSVCESIDLENQLDSYIDMYHSSHQLKPSDTMSTVDVYIECDFKMFTDFGSDVNNTLHHATSLLHTVNVIYNMSKINLNIPQINVWTTPDPYNATYADTSKDVLNAFKCELDGVYNGRIAHLISTTNQFGGIANRRDDCPYEEPLYGFSRIFKTFNADLTVFSWSVNVIAHEIGHNLSSPHTHNCSWNGNKTQIDDCANVYSTTNNNDTDCDGVIDNIEEASGSDCFDILNPIIPVKGTIMSYCHTSSGNGVDLSLGFHPQVATKMKNYIDHCLSQSTHILCPMPHDNDIQISSPDPNEMVLLCEITSGIDGYAWHIKPDLPCAEDTTIVTTNHTLSYYNVLSGTKYLIKCILNCDSGPEWGEWSCEKEYVTPTCLDSQSLMGSVSSLTKVESASDFIISQEYLSDSSNVVYFVGKESTLLEGFEVQHASIFEVIVAGCD